MNASRQCLVSSASIVTCMRFADAHFQASTTNAPATNTYTSRSERAPDFSIPLVVHKMFLRESGIQPVVPIRENGLV